MQYAHQDKHLQSLGCNILLFFQYSQHLVYDDQSRLIHLIYLTLPVYFHHLHPCEAKQVLLSLYPPKNGVTQIE